MSTAAPCHAHAETSAEQLLARAQRRRLHLPGRGVEIALLDWGGEGPLALLHHANGFCKGVWAEVAEALAGQFRVVALDARGHGDSTRPEGAGAYAWEAFAADLVVLAECLAVELGVPAVRLGLGHSFGGSAFLGAARLRPELFERLVLVDPVVPPSPRPGGPERAVHVQGLIDGARRRRRHFASRAEAREGWAERAFFADWTPRALELYLRDGLAERAEGGFELKCPGEVEAAVFAGGADADVPALAAGLATPTLFLWASRGDFSRATYEQVAASMAAARVETVEAGHLVPMEQPEQVARIALRFALEADGDPA